MVLFTVNGCSHCLEAKEQVNSYAIASHIIIHQINISNIKTKLSLSHEIALNKDFFLKLQDTKVFCDSVKIDKFETLLYQKDLQNQFRSLVVLQIKCQI